MNCSVCQRETTPIKIGGEDYCSNCGTKYAGSSAPTAITPAPTPKVAAAPVTRRVTDLSPRLATAPKPATATASVPAAAPTTPAVKPVSVSKPAAALHSRAKRSQVLDLRATGAAAKPAPAKPTVNPSAAHIPAAPPKATATERLIAKVSDRMQHAKQISRSPHINRFANQPATSAATNSATAATKPATAPGLVTTAKPTAIPHPAAPAGPELPSHVASQHQAMSRLAAATPTATAGANITPAPTPSPKPAFRPHLNLTPASSRIMAITAAITVMGGYIWLQNYPKFALQAASNRAGLSASLPGFVPSSYNLAGTDTAPGLITLNFTSPSAGETLKIAQAKTDWDSSSLLDNYVAKHTDDYTTVQGQGLTIYMFNDNQAAWVNHGVRYSIEGAARLSREQILKIAYSL